MDEATRQRMAQLLMQGGAGAGAPQAGRNTSPAWGRALERNWSQRGADGVPDAQSFEGAEPRGPGIDSEHYLRSSAPYMMAGGAAGAAPGAPTGFGAVPGAMIGAGVPYAVGRTLDNLADIIPPFGEHRRSATEKIGAERATEQMKRHGPRLRFPIDSGDY